MKKVILPVVFAVVLGFVGLFVGAQMGAYSDAVILGLRGYEGSGRLGALIGIVSGILIGLFFSRIKKPI